MRTFAILSQNLYIPLRSMLNYVNDKMNYGDFKKDKIACFPCSTVAGLETMRLVQLVLPVQPPWTEKL